MCNCVNININPVRDYRPVENRHSINPVRDYRPVENRCHTALHAVRYATCILQYGCIPYGMLRLCGIQCSTERHIPTECSSNYNTVLNLSPLVPHKRHHFRYVSNQPKNSRFQTIEFWGLNT